MICGPTASASLQSKVQEDKDEQFVQKGHLMISSASKLGVRTVVPPDVQHGNGTSLIRFSMETLAGKRSREVAENKA